MHILKIILKIKRRLRMKNDILKNQIGIDAFIEMPKDTFIEKYSEVEELYKEIDIIKEKITKEERKLAKKMEQLNFKTFIKDANNVGQYFIQQLGTDKIKDFFIERIVLLEQDKLKIKTDEIKFVTYSDEFPIFKFDGEKWDVSNLVYVINPENKDAKNMYDVCYENCKTDKEKKDILETINSVFPNYKEENSR
jgi:hypothetical protein